MHLNTTLEIGFIIADMGDFIKRSTEVSTLGLVFWCTLLQTQNIQLSLFLLIKTTSRPGDAAFDQHTTFFYFGWLVSQAPVIFLFLFWRSKSYIRLIICDILIFSCNSETWRRPMQGVSAAGKWIVTGAVQCTHCSASLCLIPYHHISGAWENPFLMLSETSFLWPDRVALRNENYEIGTISICMHDSSILSLCSTLNSVL